MPSDDLLLQATNALATPREHFDSALATAVEQLRSYLATHHAENTADHDPERAGLGSFASGRIDIARFAALIDDDGPVDVAALGRIRRAFDSLAALAAAGADPWTVEVETGGDLRQTVARALDRAGRAFGAARVAELSRSGRYSEERHAHFMDGLPFTRWSPAERELAPPLVVSVDGGDLSAAGLADFLDGALKVVLIVRGDAPPAALVRLLSPGTFVVQATDLGAVAAFAAWSGPGVAAVMPEGAACFTHDPTCGGNLSDRLSIEHLPEEVQRAALGGISRAQQAEDLAQLIDLGALVAAANRPPEVVEVAVEVPVPAGGAVPAGAATAAVDPADQLAAWLLSQAEGAGAA